jgi:hypothetical protein
LQDAIGTNDITAYFPFYDTTPLGSLLGVGYGFAAGFLVGWTFACIRNLSVLFSMEALDRSALLRTFWKTLY